MSKAGGGDDLEDDFVPDELVALSDPEGPETPSDDGDDTVFLSPDEDGEQPSRTKDQDKKRKRKEREKERKAKVSQWSPFPQISKITRRTILPQKRKLAETLEIVQPPTVAAQSPSMLVDYLSSMQAKTFSKMSGVELMDIQIPGKESHLCGCRECLIQKADREFNSGYDDMEWVPEPGPGGGFYHQE